MKEIKSKIQPNHKECQVWIDLNEDPHGSVKKHWNGTAWVKAAEGNNIKLQVEVENLKECVAILLTTIADLKSSVNSMKNYDDTKVHERINKLFDRVNKLEQFIITE